MNAGTPMNSSTELLCIASRGATLELSMMCEMVSAEAGQRLQAQFEKAVASRPRGSQVGAWASKQSETLGSVEEFEARWPRLPVTWVQFEHGGDGVFIIQREALIEHL